MDGKGHPDEVLHANEEHVIGNWEKGNPYYKEVEKLSCVGKQNL